METRPCAQLDSEGYFIGITSADESPLEPGVFLIPGGAVDAAAPDIPGGKRAKWDGVGFVLEDVPPPPQAAAPTADEVREQQRREIDRQRDIALNEGFTSDGILWHCDHTFQAQIQGFILAYSAGVLPPSATVTIRSKANTSHPLTQAQTIALAGALMQHVQGIYAASWAAKDAL